jgi:hypothetical protein
MTMEEAIHKAIRDQTAKIVEEEAEAASLRVQNRVRAKTAEIAALVLSRVSFERSGTDLRIIVDFANLGDPKPK